jgi:hypothetical protein
MQQFQVSGKYPRDISQFCLINLLKRHAICTQRIAFVDQIVKLSLCWEQERLEVATWRAKRPLSTHLGVL